MFAKYFKVVNREELAKEIKDSIEYTKTEKCCICGETKFIKESSIEDFELKTGNYDLLKCENVVCTIITISSR